MFTSLKSKSRRSGENQNQTGVTAWITGRIYIGKQKQFIDSQNIRLFRKSKRSTHQPPIYCYIASLKKKKKVGGEPGWLSWLASKS